MSLHLLDRTEFDPLSMLCTRDSIAALLVSVSGSGGQFDWTWGMRKPAYLRWTPLSTWLFNLFDPRDCPLDEPSGEGGEHVIMAFAISGFKRGAIYANMLSSHGLSQGKHEPPWSSRDEWWCVMGLLEHLIGSRPADERVSDDS